MRRKNLKLSTPNEVRKALSRITNMVLNDELDVKNANCIVAACNVILSGLRTDEQLRRIEEMEAALRERGVHAGRRY